jgi:hypothetical protein
MVTGLFIPLDLLSLMFEQEAYHGEVMPGVGNPLLLYGLGSGMPDTPLPARPHMQSRVQVAIMTCTVQEANDQVSLSQSLYYLVDV